MKSEEYSLCDIQDQDISSDLEYLNSIKVPEKLIVDQRVYEIIDYIECLHYYIDFREQSKIKDFFSKHDTFKLLTEFFVYLLSEEIDFQNTPMKNKSDPRKLLRFIDTNLNQRKAMNLYNIAFIINLNISESVDLRIKFQKEELINGILTHLEKSQAKNYYDYNNLVDLLVSNLSWASKEASDYTHMWNQINTIQKLLKFKANHEGLSIYINSIITNIASDEDIEGYLSSEINAACDMMVKMFLEYKTCPGPETSYEVLDSDNKTKVFELKTYFDKSNKCTMSVTGLLMSLYKLSVNYEIKKRINNYTGFMLTLFDLIYTGS